MMKDKIILDISDNPDLQDYFSRKEPGDECAGKFTATLDENTDGTVTLSIEDVSIEGSKEEEDSETPDEENSEDSAAVKLFKGRKASKSTPPPTDEPEDQ